MMKFGQIHVSIGRKMVIFQLLLLLIPVLAMGTISYGTSKSETTALIEKDLQHSVSMAVQMAVLLHQSVEEGLMTLEEAQEKMKEMILGPLQQDGTRPINREIDLGENGYFFVLDQEGNLLAHPLLEGDNIWDRQSSDGVYYIQDMIKKGQSGGGFTYYDWPLPDNSKEALKVSYSKLMPEWGWIIGGGSYFQDYNDGQKRIVNSMWWTLILCTVIGAALIYGFSRYLSRPINQVTKVSREIAAGNLALDPPVLKRKDELGQLAANFAGMTRTLRELVGNAKTTADYVERSVGQLTTSMDHTTDATRLITESIEKLSTGLDVQAKSTEEGARVMEEMAQGIQQIAETSASAFEQSEEMGRKARRGDEMIRLSVSQMDSVRTAFRELITAVSQLSQYSQHIVEFSNMINEIAGQTHLLALNASIEAARAGEHGQGFAVVAAEVRKLADQAVHASRQINTMIESVEATIASTNEVVRSSEREVNQGTSVIEETGLVFQDILASSRAVQEKIMEASSAAEQLSASSQEVAASIQQIAQIAADSSAGAQEVSAAAEEQLAQIQDIGDQVGKLKEQAQQLMAQVNRFNV